MTTRTRTHATRPARGRLAAAVRRLTAATDDYTRHTFNAQHELRGRR